MYSIGEGFRKAFQLIFSLDAELLGIVFLSLKVSGLALFVSSVTGISFGAFIGLKQHPENAKVLRALRWLIISLMNTFMGLPPVVLGLFLYLILSRSGPLGFMGLLYSPTAMVIAQGILAFPIIGALSHSAIVSVDPIIRQASMSLGATSSQVTATIIKEVRYGIMSGVIAGFGRVMAEVGAILIVGGNIAGYTRVMTTTIALETDKGNFELALALGIILLILSFAVNMTLYLIQKKGHKIN
ncbi:MAG: ABC transporter permease [Nitrospirae bacterium]|nr:ABC transporter permease [Nitrospirota bacterium]